MYIKEMRRAAAWWVWGLALIFALLATPATAQPARPDWTAALPGQRLAVCVTPVRPGDTAASLWRAPTDRFDCVRRGSRPPGDYWARATALPPSAGTGGPVDLRFASLWQAHATVAVRYADGAEYAIDLSPRALSRHLHLGAIVTLPLPDRHVAVTGILWRLDGAAALRDVVALPTLATPADTARSDLMFAGIYAGFAGLCFALLIYNVALYAAMRHRFQLVYCVMLLALLGYACTISGALAWLLPGIDNNVRLRVNYLTLALSASSALLFARTFFEPHIFAGRVGQITGAVVGLPVVAAIGYALVAPYHIGIVDRLFTLSFVPVLLAIAPILWRAWRLRSNYLWLFAAAWATPVAMGVLRVLTALHLVRWSIWTDQSTILAMGMEALLSSLAIAYRIRLLARERDAAREQEIAARMLADIDPLTGLLNRRAFLRQAIGREGDHALLVIDLDHFKHVNETIGHDGGDEVLRVVARALRAAVPDTALVARIGGEEFAIVTPAAHAVPPTRVLDGLRGQRMPFDIAVTASVGLCTGPLARETDWKAMYARADQALFAAKAAGRDRARDAGRILAAA